MSTISPKERVLNLFQKKEVDRIPCFSGMGNVTEYALKKMGHRFADIHLDAKKMAEASASTYELFGFECAVLPFDLCIEAEALGCEINVYAHSEGILYPTIKKKLINSEQEMEITIPDDLKKKGRIPLLVEAIKIAKNRVGNEVAIGSYVLGPFTLAGQVMDLNELLKLSFKKPDKVSLLLDLLADAIIMVAEELIDAGLDYLTVREMGATSDVLSPRVFKNLIQKPLIKVISRITIPSVLHICGKTNQIVQFMIETGATAISVDQKNDLAESRKTLGKDALIFGNLDPYNILVQGTTEKVREAVRKCIDDGASAIWPGCDIWPTIPPENFHAMMEEIKNYKGGDRS